MNESLKTRRRTDGFTLLEVMIAALFSALLLVMVSGMWTSLGRSLADTIAEGRVTAEAAMAIEALRRDLSGSLPGVTTGSKKQGRLVGRLLVGDDQLMLCFDGSPANGIAEWSSPDKVIVYEHVGDQLLRTDNGTGAEFVAARGVEKLKITNLGTGYRIELTLSRRDRTESKKKRKSKYTLITQNP